MDQVVLLFDTYSIVRFKGKFLVQETLITGNRKQKTKNRLYACKAWAR